MDYTAYLTFFITMAAIINPLGDLAIFIGLMGGHSVQKQKKVAIEAGITVCVILLLSVWVGVWFLKIFGINPNAFEAAGGMVLFLIGVTMITGNDTPTGKSNTNINEKEEELHKQQAQSHQSLGVVPIAIPIAVGPGAIAACIIHAHAFHGMVHKMMLSGVCVLLAFMSFIFFYFASFFARALGDSGIQIITRIMGMVLLAIAIGMMTTGTVHLVQSIL